MYNGNDKRSEPMTRTMEMMRQVTQHLQLQLAALYDGLNVTHTHMHLYKRCKCVCNTV